VEAPGRGSTLGRLEVPRLGLSTIVIEGDDEYNLLVGVGHLPETPLPWHDGNSVLAGHRDTDFRPLRNIQAGDTIQFHTADIIVEYIVRETEIVEPTDLTVLRATDVPTLTLITCYPFTYVGPAPKRFVVRAERTTTATKSDSKIASDSA
jgi:sortase A